MPSPSTSRPTPTGPARHREDIGHRVVRRQLVAGNPVGEHHMFGDPEGVGEAMQRGPVRAPTDDDEGGAGHPLPDRRKRPDQHVLPLARHQP